jgi:hypothetical protein
MKRDICELLPGDVSGGRNPDMAIPRGHDLLRLSRRREQRRDNSTSGASTPGASTPGASTPGASTPGASTPGASFVGARPSDARRPPSSGRLRAVGAQHDAGPPELGPASLGPAGQPSGACWPTAAGTLFNGMVAPFTHNPVAGVLWYQGERTSRARGLNRGT